MYNIKIGFRGGGIIGELGTGGDMQLFFDCIQYYVVPKYPELNWSILTDRFYRHYLQFNELDAAEAEMKLVEDVFKELDKDAVDWGSIQSSEVKSDLDLTKNNLFDIFSEYFELFYQCIEFGKYQGNKNSEYNKY